MNNSDFPQFHSAWVNAHAMSSSNQTPSDAVIMSVFDILVEYPLQSVELAIKHHARQSRFAPTPHDIVDLLDAGNRRLSADEAWAMMPKVGGMETVVWTNEMADAYDAAYDLLVDGDRIAARMAFKGAYERFCSEALMMRSAVVWKVCCGDDKTKIEPALKKAVLLGRITQEAANKLLPAPAYSGLIAGLLVGSVTELPADNENLKARWSDLKAAMASGARKLAGKELKIADDANQRRFAFEQKKQEMLVQVDERLQAGVH